MKNEPMKCFDFEEPTSEYYTQMRELTKYVTDVQKGLAQAATVLTEMLKEYEESEKKKEADLAVQKAYEMFVKKDGGEPVLDNSLDQECPVDEKVFGKEKSVDDFSILNLIPEQAKKWVERLTIAEMLKVLNDVDNTEWNSKDEFISELVDQLKDMAIAKYTNDILAGRITTIEDEEIRSEVVDYMIKKGFDIPTKLQKQKQEITDPINEYIKRLDKGETLELSNEYLTKIINRLWNTRANLNIRVNNNKIKLG